MLYCTDRLRVQIYEITHNITAVELAFAKSQKKNKGIDYINIYDKGNWRSNIQEVFQSPTIISNQCHYD